MSYEFSVDEIPTIEIRVASGRADFHPGAPGRVEVDVTGSGSEFVVVEQLGSTILVREERRLFGGRSVNIRVSTPPGSHLDATVASMDIYSRVDLGRINLQTASGDLDLGQADNVVLRSASGDVKIDEVLNNCEVSSASGDVRVHQVSGDLIVSTASGDIIADRIEGRCELKSASGEVRVGCCRGGLIELKSMSGDLRVGIPTGTRVEAEIDSLSGDVRLPKTKSSAAPDRDAKLRARTVSGDIEVVRVDG
ncbi:MAG: DUF4097 family beta strand repeat-containing protein [Acidimicrobiia bacterium]